MGKANHGRWVAYTCQLAREAAAHPYPRNVTEAAILRWVRDEVAHIDLGGDWAAAEAKDAAQRADLAERLERAHRLYIDGPKHHGITREEYEREEAAITAALDALGSRVVVQDLGNLDELWTWAPADTNRVVRAILERVDLDATMRPVSATWRTRPCAAPATMRRALIARRCGHEPRTAPGPSDSRWVGPLWALWGAGRQAGLDIQGDVDARRRGARSDPRDGLDRDALRGNDRPFRVGATPPPSPDDVDWWTEQLARRLPSPGRCGRVPEPEMSRTATGASARYRLDAGTVRSLRYG